MSSNALATQNGHASGVVDIATVEQVITGGDLGQLSAAQRVRFYIETCESLKLNWRTKPFDVVSLRGGPKTLYPNKGCAEQLAQLHNISVDLLEATTEEGVRIQKAKACLASGRCVTKTGAVNMAGKRGEDYANAVMKCETKAHRRAVLALVGLNMPDESELESIPGSQRFTMDVESGEIAQQASTPQRPQRPAPAPESRPARPAVTAEVVDAETGEILFNPETATQQQIRDEITRLRMALGWTELELREYAQEHSISGRSRAGQIEMIAALREQMGRAFAEDTILGPDDEDDDEPEQGTLIEAEARGHWDD